MAFSMIQGQYNLESPSCGFMEDETFNQDPSPVTNINAVLNSTKAGSTLVYLLLEV